MNQNRKCVSTIFFGIPGYFEIKVLEIWRADHIYSQISKTSKYLDYV